MKPHVHRLSQLTEVTGHPVRSHPQFFQPHREGMPESAFSLQGSMSSGHQILGVVEGQPLSNILGTPTVCNELHGTRMATMAVQIDVG